MRAGAIAWIASIQFFVMQAVAQSAWTTPYSLVTNYISDLGNTVCDTYPSDFGRFVCPPWHPAKNASFILIGLTTAFGAILLRNAQRSGRSWSAGLALIAIVLGLVGLSGTALFVKGRFLGPGVGGMERFAAYPLPLGTIGLGIWRERTTRTGGSDPHSA